MFLGFLVVGMEIAISFPKGKLMNDLILSKMREDDWGEVVRLMREEYGPTLGTER